ncbi:SRPBCC domain-containing protein [Parapedobacter sp. GCM10030251]|uniref:SRPBCC family protein n=1 Tax=Parapedobacter sp. GCM10030251 TaxID=3273419 RepID=UPI0036097168
MNETFTTTIAIHADPGKVWTTLTDFELMSQWMGEPETNVQVSTDLEIGSPIYIRGFHHISFENKGLVLAYDTEKRLSYTHLSSLSRLADRPENYSTIEFILAPVDRVTRLTLNITNFPTDTIRKHLEFYWNTTISIIKENAEGKSL